MLKKTDFKNITILSAIILVIGVYLIATTVLISKDGTLYINCAKDLAEKPFVNAVRNLPTSIGYPFLIYLTHNTLGLFTNTESLQSWILSAQTVSLVSKLIAAVALYFVGSFLVGRKAAFWGILILNVLPDSAEYGSDALTEWPYLMFLALGFLMLLWGSRFGNIWMFALAGAAAGIGYLVRSEGCQLLIYGGIWLTYCLIRPQNKMLRSKAITALILLAAGFIVTTLPYMLSQGYVFPDQRLMKIPSLISGCDTNNHLAGLFGSTIGNKNLMKNICETLVYYFVPGLLIGCWHYFRKQSKTAEQTFYSSAFIILNITMCLWQLYGRQLHYLNFLSRRHTLALVVFTIFYIPIGVQIISDWISLRTSKKEPIDDQSRRNWYYILIAIGIMICSVKLITHTAMQKTGFINAAIWLNQNTTVQDIIAVPDGRITFYAERTGNEYSNEMGIPGQTGYVVRIVKCKEERSIFDKKNTEIYSTWVNRKKDKKLLIYKNDCK